MVVVVVIGLLAAMALPAFRRVRAQGQDKAVRNNLRQLASAADQYFLQYGKTRVNYTEIVGTGKYITAIKTVAKETYPTNFRVQRVITATGVAGQRTVTYSY